MDSFYESAMKIFVRFTFFHFIITIGVSLGVIYSNTSIGWLVILGILYAMLNMYYILFSIDTPKNIVNQKLKNLRMNNIFVFWLLIIYAIPSFVLLGAISLVIWILNKLKI
jgi:hypothetical protein